MIFNNYLTEKEIVEKLIRESGIDEGFILSANYDEKTGQILLDEISYILEAYPGVPAKELYINNDKNNKRYVLIGGSADGGHGPRMKISKKGSTGSSSTITLRFDKKGIHMIGELKDINMSSKEFKDYVNFAKKHINLIKIAADKNKTEAANNALCKDAKLEHDNIEYERSEDGTLTIYDTDKKGRKVIKSMETLEGKEIKI